jgi:hypothetical protein
MSLVRESGQAEYPPVVRAAPFRFRSFYFLMSLLISGVVAYGFGQTIGENLIHPSVSRPWVLYVHASIFFGWVAVFVVQTALVQTRHVRWHRRFGWVGAVTGASIPLLGVVTSLSMARFNILHGLDSPDGAAAFLIVPLNDMVDFSICVAIGISWRRRPEYHRRLLLIATCCLTAAAFARLPFITIQALRWYAGVDALILLGLARDLIVNRNIHAVYRYALPAVVFGQVVTMILFLQRVPAWMAIGRWLIG